MAYEVETEMTSEPSLFVISKNERSPELVTTTLAFYYILNGNVYQAPKAYAVLSTRIVQSMFHLKNAFSAIQEKVRSSVHHWSAKKRGNDGRKKLKIIIGGKMAKPDMFLSMFVIALTNVIGCILLSLPHRSLSLFRYQAKERIGMHGHLGLQIMAMI